MTSRVLAGFCALCLYAQTPCRAASTPRDTAMVDVHVEFDRSVTKTVKRQIEEEAASIWKAHDVELQYGGSDDAAMHLDVFIGQLHGDPEFERLPPVLGQTKMDGLTHGIIRVSLEAVEWTLECSHARHMWLDGSETARAIGRVLAHEIGHALLGGPPFHDVSGLMRPSFKADDLARRESAIFQLTKESDARLRDRIARLLIEQSGAKPRVEPR